MVDLSVESVIVETPFSRIPMKLLNSPSHDEGVEGLLDKNHWENPSTNEIDEINNDYILTEFVSMYNLQLIFAKNGLLLM